ncbi:MAG: phosphotransferase [Steroidobacteraceae bacterium]
MATAADDDAMIAAAFAKLPMLGPVARWKIAALPGGIANRSWLIEAADCKLVLRVPVEATAELGVDRASEHAALLAAAGAGLAAPLVYFDTASGLMLAQYLAGRAWTRTDTHDERCVRRLAATLKRLHAVEPPQAARRLDYAELLASYRHSLDTTRGLKSRASAAFDRDADRRLETLHAKPQPGVLCHNDVHRRNIVDGESLWLIDWEYAAVGDGRYDLASFACYHELDAAERQFLLDSYDRANANHLARTFGLCCWLFDYMHLLWLELTAGAPAEREPLAARLAHGAKDIGP